MAEVTPTRSVLLEMKDEHRAMHEGYVFLDEKCLLLAGEILRELGVYTDLRARLLGEHAQAVKALEAAVLRHGLEELQVHPVEALDGDGVVRTPRALMGVRLQDARWQEPIVPVTPAESPEAAACRNAFVALVTSAVALAALAGNLERLYREYRRTVRRARALHDVLLPELARDVADLDTRLEELEQEDAIWMRRGAAGAA